MDSTSCNGVSAARTICPLRAGSRSSQKRIVPSVRSSFENIKLWPSEFGWQRSDNPDHIRLLGSKGAIHIELAFAQ